MLEIKHIHREGNREIRETLDMEHCEQPYNYNDRITIGKQGKHTFNLTEDDFEDLYQRKLKMIDNS